MISELFDVGRVKSTVHNWVDKTAIEPASGASPDRVAVDQTVILLVDIPKTCTTVLVATQDAVGLANAVFLQDSATPLFHPMVQHR